MGFIENLNKRVRNFNILDVKLSQVVAMYVFFSKQ